MRRLILSVSWIGIAPETTKPPTPINEIEGRYKPQGESGRSRPCERANRPSATHSVRRRKHKDKKVGLVIGASLLCGLILPAYGAVEITYGYDDLNRLVSATRSDGPAIAYQYDAVGNFISQGVSNSPDIDGDLIANFADPDDDGDGMPDTWEAQYGFNPLDPADAGQDADGDGISNLAEYQTGGNPLVAAADADIPFVPGWGLLVLAASLMGIAIRQTHGRRI